jgi:hypothetical protein
LDALIGALQKGLRDLLGETFRPYALEQVHATIIGLEGTLRNDSQLINTNYLELRQEARVMDLTKALDVIQHAPLLPMSIRIGGYRSEGHYGFTSRNQHPHLRSFSLQGDKAVTVAWPYQDGRPRSSLDRLRRSFNEANILHKYHAATRDTDNDLFFVLGHVEALGTTERQDIETAMRSLLADRDPLDVLLDKTKLSLVAYSDPELPAHGPRRSEVRTLVPLPPTAAELLGFYHTTV